ncbi:uncharacterized protein LOC113301741 [Papaver somniferum]|uniref:uncharacterized protein LOC113301741 n=1 Tax=Papaver somniferum TaxID=3469 RepID=UPI000E704F4F|nr:uncharacterized protein LOC113301741 [Papaver somniferum]
MVSEHSIPCERVIMIINRVDFEAEVKNSIVELKVGFEAAVKNSFADLKVVLEAFTTKLRDVDDCLNKMKSDEDSLKPLSEDVESKSVSDFTLYSSTPVDLNLADEGNYKSTTKAQISHMDEAVFEVEVQKYHGDSTFLAYQEDLNGSLNVKEDDNGDTIRLLDKILQQVIIMWIISTLQKTRERKLGNAQDTFEQLLVKDFRLLTYMKVYWKGFEVIEIAATSCKLFILIVFRPLVFLPNFDLTWILFDSWSMENGCGYILVSVGLLAYRSSIVCINKGLDSSYDETHLLQLKSGLY